MLLRQMKYFVSVVDCNSFTEAAEQNYISQSAISQQIQALEKDLGVPLIIRRNRRFSLTPAGEYFYNHCKGILVEVEDLRRETVQLGKDSELQLRIGYLRCYSGQELSGFKPLAQHGRIDVIVSNAAGYGLFGCAEELNDEEINHIIATNLTGSIMLIKDSLPYLRSQGGGRIIQMSTYGGQVAYPANSMYHATKFGIERFCKGLLPVTR